EVPQQPKWPQRIHIRSRTQLPPMRRQSSQPSLDGSTSATVSRWAQAAALIVPSTLGQVLERLGHVTGKDRLPLRAEDALYDGVFAGQPGQMAQAVLQHLLIGDRDSGLDSPAAGQLGAADRDACQLWRLVVAVDDHKGEDHRASRPPPGGGVDE